jgi:hypothetical protein
VPRLAASFNFYRAGAPSPKWRVAQPINRRQCELVHRPAQTGPLSLLHCSPYRYSQFSPAEKAGLLLVASFDFVSGTGQNLFFGPVIVAIRQGSFGGRLQSLHRRARRHFTGHEPLFYADDAEVIEKAKRPVDGHDVELWSGPRLAIRISHKQE